MASTKSMGEVCLNPCKQVSHLSPLSLPRILRHDGGVEEGRWGTLCQQSSSHGLLTWWNALTR